MSRKINPLSRSRRAKDTDPVADGERQLLINEQPSKVILYMSGKATYQESGRCEQQRAIVTEGLMQFLLADYLGRFSVSPL
jgi:hypothetical protein